MSNFTLDSFKEELYEFYNKPPESRDFVVMTGARGKSVIDNMIKRIAAETLLDELKASDKVSDEEYISLNKMIDSPDNENLIVAVAIIDQKIKHEQ